MKKCVCIILAFLLMLSSFAGVLLVQAQRLTSERGLYLSVGKQMNDERLQAASQAIARVGEKQHFAPETVTPLVTPTLFANLDEETVDWVFALLRGNSGMMPRWVPEELIDALCEDETFKANVSPYMLHIVARDEAGAAISEAVCRTVWPLRLSLLAVGVQTIAQKVNVPAVVSAIPTALVFCAILSVVLMVAMLLVMHKHFANALPYLSAGLTAGALLLLLTVGGLLLLDLPSRCAEVSVLFAHQLTLIGQQLMLSTLIPAIVMLVIGQLLLIRRK